jgi:hypothetical protein
MCNAIWCFTNEEGMAVLWAAVITAIPAILAILFAYRVGSRQVDIAKRQTDVAEATLALERDRLRAELYDRRSAVYSAARAFGNAVLTTGKVPGIRPNSNERDEAIYAEFLDAVAASEFVFDNEVAAMMDNIHMIAINLHYDEFVLAGQPDAIMKENVQKRFATEAMRKGLDDLREGVRPYLALVEPHTD